MDLGKYAQVVLWSYAGTIVLIGALVVFSIWQAVKIRRTLRMVEARQVRQDG